MSVVASFPGKAGNCFSHLQHLQAMADHCCSPVARSRSCTRSRLRNPMTKRLRRQYLAAQSLGARGLVMGTDKRSRFGW